MNTNIPIENRGQFSVSPLDPCEVGSFASFELRYVVGPYGMDDKSSIRFVFHGAKDYSEPQFSDPTGAGYTTVEISSGAPAQLSWDPFINERPWFNTLEVRLVEGGLKPGDEILLRLGDTRHCGPGFQMQTYCQDEFKFRALVNPFSTQQFFEVGSMPHLEVIPGSGLTWRSVTPSQISLSDTFWIGLKCEDLWGNPSNKTKAKLHLSSNLPLDGMPDVISYEMGYFSKRLENIKPTCEGDVIIEILGNDGTLLTKTNPMRVIKEPLYRHYWADLHGQTGETIGTNSADRYFEFARDKAFLDMCSHQGNDIQITNAFWQELNQVTRRFDAPGRFLAVPGYEWSANSSVGGDHNIWYRYEDRPIYRAHRALVDDDPNSTTDCIDAHQMFDAMLNEDVAIAAHCGGRYADVKYAHDGRTENAVEIHSAWGTFEWILQDALESNYRIGLVANSDGHKGRPGASYPGRSFFTAMGGLTCYLMKKLDRDDLFEAMRRRHAYATTGARMILDTSVSGTVPFRIYDRDPDVFGDQATFHIARNAIMGDIVEVDSGEIAVSFKVSASVNDAIERIDLFDGLDIIKTINPQACPDSSKRVRILWEGANYRGRGRNAKWAGTLKLVGNTIERCENINFLTPTIIPRQLSNSEVEINGVTAGGAQGVDLWLKDSQVGRVIIKTSQGDAQFHLANLTKDDTKILFGGLGIGVRAFRLPERCDISDFEVTHSVALRSDGDTRLYARVTQIDGHQAWSSPIYLMKNAERVEP